MLSTANKIAEIKLVTARRDNYTEDDIVALAEDIVKLDDNSLFVLLVVRDNVRLFVSAGPGTIKAGINAGQMASELAAIVGGGGGGKQYFGQGGGTAIDKADQVFAKAQQIVESTVN